MTLIQIIEDIKARLKALETVNNDATANTGSTQTNNSPYAVYAP